MIKEYIVEVKSIVRVKVDLDNFTDKFMKWYKDNYYNFNEVEDHIRNLAHLYSNGYINLHGGWVEGYGSLDGIEFNMMDWETKIINEEKE